MKSVLIDASSAILLYKVDLIEYQVRLYRTLMTVSVFDELSRQEYAGARLFDHYRRHRQITLCPPLVQVPDGNEIAIDLPALNAGERDTILGLISGKADFLVTDDGKAARYCRKTGLPFINALLFPRILAIGGHISESDRQARSQQLLVHGRYSRCVIDQANQLPEASLRLFLPEPG